MALEAELLDAVQENGYCSVSELAERFNVATSTVRRNLARLEEMKLVERTHGGARAASVFDTPFAFKETLHLAEKRAIGKAMADLIEDRHTVLLDSGSTTLEVARHLVGRPVTVVTNDLRIGLEIAKGVAPQLVVIGGELVPNVFTLCGTASVEQLAQLRVDIAVFGADAIDEGGIFNFSSREVEVKQQMQGIAKQTYFVADHTKFGREALFKVFPISGFTGGVTDMKTPEAILQKFPVPVRRVNFS